MDNVKVLFRFHCYYVLLSQRQTSFPGTVLCSVYFGVMLSSFLNQNTFQSLFQGHFGRILASSLLTHSTTEVGGCFLFIRFGLCILAAVLQQ